MNPIIGLQIDNAQTLVLSHINKGDVTHENFIETEPIPNIVNIYYSMIDSNLRENFSIDDFKKELLKRFEQKDPTQPIAQDYLENWLNSSIRNNEEKRFNVYKKLLVNEGKGEMIPQMEADTYGILDSCHNPKELNFAWDRRGLVYGHVQSGKTANYIGLINRAFDSGYQIVIVLTGMTEDLRNQTQSRIDEGVVGQRGGKYIGVGKNISFQNLTKIKPATTLQNDYGAGDLTVRNQDLLAANFSLTEKSIWVIKKNKTVLENLIKWLDSQRTRQDGRINNVPFLIIDDEADNASIQSMSKRDYESWGEGQRLSDLDSEELTTDQEEILKNAQKRVIKAINRNIRVILSLISHKTFVAYTATPYSIINQSEKDIERNVNIDGKTFKIDANSDLFPEHFIIPITAGSKYMGIDKIFNTNICERLPVLIDVSEKYPNEKLDKNYFPTKRGISYSFIDLPESLEDAILYFIVSIIIRKYRGHQDYNSLLIHTSHLTNNADYVADRIEKFITKLRNKLFQDNVEYLSRIEKIFSEIKQNSKNTLFKKYFNYNYTFPDKITKENVLDVLLSKMDSNHEYIYAPFEVVSYHSSNDKNLKHQNHNLRFNLMDLNGNKKFKNYIVVGGNRLSRGLTLEGLSISYFVRNSTRQDSLYQMGRWFGYRIGFEDLVRIFMPTDQILWFEGVYKLEMGLRKDFEENNNEDEDVKLLPRDMVIKMAYYTNDDMNIPHKIRKKFPAICDPNKLRNTRKQAMSFSGTTKTNRIIYDKNVQENNMKVVINLFKTIKKDPKTKLFDVTQSFVPDELRKNKNSNYVNVNFAHIIELLQNYEAHNKIKYDVLALIDFIKKNNVELENWSLVLVNKGSDKNTKLLGDFYENKQIQENKPIGISTRDGGSELEPNQENPNTIYFKSILDQQKDNIFDIINTSNYDEYKNAKRKADVVKKYRNESKKPLMLIIPAKTSKAEEIEVFPLLYCFIPALDNTQKVTYIIRNN